MRQGFTILELIVATAILTVLLSAVWTVTSFLLRAETRRSQQTDQQRIVRHWTQIINDDFRTVIQDTDQLNKTQGEGNIRHFGVSGTATVLRIDISDYSWRSEDSSELRTIFYEFDSDKGLERRERGYAALKSVEGAIRTAPEIVKGEFRYYDGSSWHEHWSSIDRKSAPSAIEVTFYSLPLAEAVSWRNRMGTTEPFLNRVKVQVPPATRGISEPYRRAQPPPPPRAEVPISPPPPPAPPSPPRPQPPPPPSPLHSLFGDD